MANFTEQQVVALLQEFSEKGSVTFAGLTFASGTAPASNQPVDPEAARIAEVRASARQFNKARTGRTEQSLEELKAEILATLAATLPERDRIAEVRASARVFSRARTGGR